MVEAELHLEVASEDLDRALGGEETVYDVAEAILARKPCQRSDRRYLLMRGRADFLRDGVAFATETQRDLKRSPGF